MFEIAWNQPKRRSRLIYWTEDHACNFWPEPWFAVSSETSVCWDTLQLGIDLDGQVLGVRGYWPSASWHSTSLQVPDASPGELWYRIDQPLTPGVSLRVNPPGIPRTGVD